MRFDDLFSNISDKTAGRLSEEYPVLKDEQKERLYAMSKRKYNINETFDNNGSEVSGVEKYRRPKWYNGASIAAAAVLLVAGIGGSIAFISRNGHSPAADVDSSVAETTEAVTEEVTEEVTEIAEEISESEETDVNFIANELVGGYRELICELHAGNLEVDKNNPVKKTVILPDGVEGQKDFYRVIDPKYPTWADVENRCFEIGDEEFGKKILEICLWNSEEEFNYNTLIYNSGDEYYIEKGIHDCADGPIKWDDYIIKTEADETGNIIAVVRDTEPSDYIIESTFTIVNTENGWRISNIEDKIVGKVNDDNKNE